MRRGAAGSTGTWRFSGRAGAPCGGGGWRGGSVAAPPPRRRGGPRETRDDPDLDRVETQRLEVLQKRLGERVEMERNLEIVTSQIATLEHSIAYLADKLVSWSAAGREPQGLREILAGGGRRGRAIVPG